MGRSITKTGKRTRPRTAPRGKRYLCAVCRKRSPRPVFEPAPWYCEKCKASGGA
jgi:ribosomal protein L37AE/L43A